MFHLRGRCDFERENVELATPSVFLWPIVRVEKTEKMNERMWGVAYKFCRHLNYFCDLSIRPDPEHTSPPTSGIKLNNKYWIGNKRQI